MAFTMAQAMMWVKLSLLRPCKARCLLIVLRFSSMTRTGSWRCDVATGMARLAVMFSAMRAAAPRNGISWSLAPTVLADCFAGCAGLVVATAVDAGDVEFATVAGDVLPLLVTGGAEGVAEAGVDSWGLGAG